MSASGPSDPLVIHSCNTSVKLLCIISLLISGGWGSGWRSWVRRCDYLLKLFILQNVYIVVDVSCLVFFWSSSEKGLTSRMSCQSVCPVFGQKVGLKVIISK